MSKQSRVLCLLVAVALHGCGDDGPAPREFVPGDASFAELECVDEDGDGFGAYCPLGSDCDDGDPDSTDECYVCVGTKPEPDCPCEPGTPPVECNPDDIIVDEGTLVCSEGTYFCRDAYWSTCENLIAYVLVKN